MPKNIRSRWDDYTTTLKLTWKETDPPERMLWVPFAVIIVPAHAIASELNKILQRRLKRRK